jgi:putative ABC transport system ATP-binding protein
MNNIVVAKDLHRTYQLGGIHALRGVNLRVRIGEFVAIKGRSGSGKTTLLNIIGGLDRNYSGTVVIDTAPLKEISEEERIALRRTKIGFVFQSFGLLPHFSCLETIDFALRLSGHHRRERRKHAVVFLTQVGLEDRLDHRPDELSGGQQQRLCIARAIAIQPALILADEPTGELDSHTGREIFSLFRQIVALGNIGLIIATHDPVIDEYATSIYELEDGKLSEIKRGVL